MNERVKHTTTANRQGQGQALVEFAAIATILFMLVMGIIEFGRAFYYYSAIVNAAQEGGRYASVNSQHTDIISKTIQSAVSVGLTPSNVVVTCSNGPCSTSAYGDTITVTVRFTFTPVISFVPSFPLNAKSSMFIDYAW